MSSNSYTPTIAEKIALKKIAKIAMKFFFNLLGILSIVLYILAMLDEWPFGNTDVPTKIVYTIWWVVILSLFDSKDLKKALHCIKRKQMNSAIEGGGGSSNVVNEQEG